MHKKPRKDREVVKYTRWVRSTKQYVGPKIELFRVCFNLEHKFELDIIDWIMFALKKRVEKLELDLLTFCDHDFMLDLCIPSLLYLRVIRC